jgi:hypothetical protein
LNQDFDASIVVSSVFDELNNRRPQGGIAIMWRKNIGYAMSDIVLDVKTDRIMAVRLESPNNVSTIIVNVYFPSTNMSISQYRNVLDQLQVVYDTYASQGVVILSGDFNAQLGDQSGPRGNNPQSIRGKLLLEFIIHNNVCSMITQSVCTGPICTFGADDSVRQSTQIDHFIMSRTYMYIVDRCYVADDHSANTSDHVPIYIKITLNVKRYEPQQRPVYIWSKCNITEYGQVLRDNLIKEVGDNEISDAHCIDEYLLGIQTCVQSAMTQCVPLLQKCPFKRPYWDDDLKLCHNVQKVKRQIWISQGRPRGMQHESYRSYKIHKKAFAKLLIQKHQEYEQKRFEEAESNYEIDTRALWKYLKRSKSDSTDLHAIKVDGKVYASPRELREMWRDHYDKLLNEQVSEAPQFDEDFKTHIHNEITALMCSFSTSDDSTGILHAPFTVNEVADVCKGMPNHKSPGADNVSYESIKYGGFEILHHLTVLYNAIVNHIHVPESLKHSIIIPIHKGKKKSKDVLNSYRGISLSPIINKILEKVVLNRLKPWLKTQKFPPSLQQSGREGTSSVAVSYMVQEVINHFRDRGSKVFASFLDIQQAFDRIWWDGLLYKLSNIGIKGKLWWLFREWLVGSSCNIMVNGELSDSFTISRSIKQGGLLSMFYFCVSYYDIHQEAIQPPAVGLTYYDVDMSTPTFADDTLLMSLSVSNLQLMLDNVYRYGSRWRVRFSSSKSCCLTFGESRCMNNRNRLTRQWHLGNAPIEEVDHCIYLGNTMSAYKSGTARIKEVSKKGYSHLGILTAIGFNAQGMNPLTSAVLWHRLCIPSMLFACEVWGPLTRKEYDILEKVQRTVAKHIQGLNWRTHNEIVLGMVGWLTIESTIHRNKLLFVRQLLSLNNHNIIKHVVLHELYEQVLSPSLITTNNLTADYVSLMNKYGLSNYLVRYLHGGQFPQKTQWKAIVNDQVNKDAQANWSQNLKTKKANRFVNIQPTLKHNALYGVIKRNKYARNAILLLIQLLSIPDNCNVFVCNLCNKQTDDYVEHILIRCEQLLEERNDLWENIVNVLGVKAEVELFCKEDEDIMRIMLGKEWQYLNKDQYDQFICIVARAVTQLCRNTNFRQLAVFRN